jgi:hypothetical protein
MGFVRKGLICNNSYRRPTEVWHSAHRGSSNRCKGAVSHIINTVPRGFCSAVNARLFQCGVEAGGGGGGILFCT